MKDLSAAFKQQPPYQPGPVDPVDLFRTLKIRAGSPIKELWAPQSDALREWHSHRSLEDTLVQLNTGAGKTLIGLLAAQSLVNETQGRVLYCCATKQLVDQTSEKADELGLPTATYHSGQWVNQDTYQMGRVPVITTYAALLNGRSIFRNDALTGLILDDAHTAHDAVRSAFTLSIDRREHAELYVEMTERVRAYFSSVDRDFIFDAVVEHRDSSTVLMVPMFELQRHIDQFGELLLKAGVEGIKEMVFPWSHIGAKLDRCVFLFDHQRIEFTPLLPPIQQIRAFRDGVRRVYLSATLKVDDEFVRTFGRVPQATISPGGRAGDSERLMLFPPSGSNEVDARAWAEETTGGLKAAIMVPSWAAAEAWRDHADVFGKDDGHERVRQFAGSADERLVFVARYDGIDLPDDSCRVMVVDGLPSGLALLDRFFEQHLERAGISSSKVASRFLQLLGRTSRGMSDFGVVLLVGARLLNWILPAGNRRLLPAHIQRQLALGERLSAMKDFSGRELVDLCLRQASEWADVYQRGMGEAKASEPSGNDIKRDHVLALAERRAADAYWEGDYESGASELLTVRDAAFAAERSLGAWFLHWVGFGHQMAGDMDSAHGFYSNAAAVKRELGRIPGASGSSALDKSAYSAQSANMASLLEKRGAKRIHEEIQNIQEVLVDDEASAGMHEEAIRVLGEYLGLRATRPEKETAGKGPDDLWVSADGTLVLFFDAKTKMDSAHYSKKQIGESAQHSLWVAEQHPKAEHFHYLVGPRVPATPQSTPPPGLRVIAPAELSRLARDLDSIYHRAADRNLPLFHAAEIELGLRELGLEWAALPESWETVRLDAL